jgi:hypothetical protein
VTFVDDLSYSAVLVTPEPHFKDDFPFQHRFNQSTFINGTPQHTDAPQDM